MAGIAQMSVTYADVEDRLLFRVATTKDEEFCLWLTRRLALGILGVATKVAAPDVVGPIKSEVAAFEREHAIATLDFEQEYQSKPRERKLGNAPALILEVRLTHRGNYLLQVQIQSGAWLDFNLSADLYHGFIELVRKGAVAAAWLAEDAAESQRSASSAAAPTRLH